MTSLPPTSWLKVSKVDHNPTSPHVSFDDAASADNSTEWTFSCDDWDYNNILAKLGQNVELHLWSYSPTAQTGEVRLAVCRWCRPLGPWCVRSQCVWVWRGDGVNCRTEIPPLPVARSPPASAGTHLRTSGLNENECWMSLISHLS